MSSTVLPADTRLFYYDGSPFAQICRMALRELGHEGRVQEVLTTLRDPSATVLPHNPVGRVPALVLPDGTTLTETVLILAWLDSVTADRKIFPADASALAAYGRVMGLLDGMAVWHRELRRPENERSPAVVALEATRAERVADALESDVANGGYSRIDAGYLTLLVVLGFADRRQTVWPWRQGRPALAEWFDQASQLPSYAATLPVPAGN